jgi:hypothetical protein
MKFNTYQKIALASAAILLIPDEIKDLVRSKQPQTFLGGKVRYDAPHPDNGDVERFSLLFPQDGTEVTLEEGDYLIETSKGLVGKSKAAFEEEYGLIEAEEAPAAEEVVEEDPNAEPPAAE